MLKIEILLSDLLKLEFDMAVEILGLISSIICIMLISLMSDKGTMNVIGTVILSVLLFFSGVALGGGITVDYCKEIVDVQK